LKELVVIHPDPQYLQDIKSLENYIYEELNVRDIVVTSDEDKFGIKYKVEADQKVLGQKLKKEAPKVRKALPDVTSDEVKQFMQSKQITVAGHTLTEEDLNVRFWVLKNLTSLFGRAAISNTHISLFHRSFVSLRQKLPRIRPTATRMF
jgi:isoleucyl-tRNA synthetase